MGGTGWKGGLAEGLIIVFTILTLSTIIPPYWLVVPLIKMKLINYLILSLK